MPVATQWYPRPAFVQGEEDEEYRVEYAGCILTLAERNKSTMKCEALAVLWAVNKYKTYTEVRR